MSGEDLAQITDLEATVVAADGGRLKLDWTTLRSRSGHRVEDLLWVERDRLVGFLGCYRFGRAIELSGMVAPDRRHAGIGTQLLRAALELCGDDGDVAQVLLVVPGHSAGGRHLSEVSRGRWDHAEHAMELTVAPDTGQAVPGLTLRPATTSDLPALAALLEAGFGHPASAEQVLGADSAEPTTVVDLGGDVVGTLRTARHEDTVSVYGFVVHPTMRGQGIGRDVLGRVCRNLFAGGAARIQLEVEVDNERALHLYTSLGFGEVASEDYYELPTPLRR